MDLCGAPHPERPDLTCKAPVGPHADHINGITLWDNTSFVPPPPPSVRGRRAKATAEDHARLRDLTERARQATLADAPGPKTGADHPETSHRAATVVRHESQKAKALLYVVDHSEGGTAREVGVALGIAPNQAATRLLELREAMLVEYLVGDDGTFVERETTPGCTGLVHVPTRDGYREAASLRVASGLRNFD